MTTQSKGTIRLKSYSLVFRNYNFKRPLTTKVKKENKIKIKYKMF